MRIPNAKQLPTVDLVAAIEASDRRIWAAQWARHFGVSASSWRNWRLGVYDPQPTLRERLLDYAAGDGPAPAPRPQAAARAAAERLPAYEAHLRRLIQEVIALRAEIAALRSEVGSMEGRMFRWHRYES